VNNGTVTHYEGNLADYEATQLALIAESKDKKTKAAPVTATPAKVIDKETKKIIQQIERDLSALQTKLEKIEKELTNPTLYDAEQKTKLQKLLQDQVQLKKMISEKEAEWMQLSSIN
jgi:ATP-binding cassette subfamily F protein 3